MIQRYYKIYNSNLFLIKIQRTLKYFDIIVWSRILQIKKYSVINTKEIKTNQIGLKTLLNKIKIFLYIFLKLKQWNAVVKFLLLRTLVIHIQNPGEGAKFSSWFLYNSLLIHSYVKRCGEISRFQKIFIIESEGLSIRV